MKRISQIKHLGKNSTIFGLGYFIPLTVNVLLLPIYVRYLSTGEYGALSLLVAFGAILAIVMNVSVNRAIERFYVEYGGEERKKFLGSSIIFVIAYSALLGIFLSLVAKKISFFIFKDSLPLYVYCFTLQIWITFFLMFSQFITALYVIKEKSVSYAVIRIINFLILIAAILYSLIFLQRGFAGIFEAMLFASVIMSIGYAVLILPDVSLSFKLAHIRKFLRYSLPLVPYRFFIILIAYVDRFYINRFISLQDVGLYSAGIRLSMGMEVLVSSFAIAWIPFYYNRIEKESSGAAFGKLITLWAAVLIFAGLTTSLFSKEIVMIFTKEAYYAAHRIIPLLTLGYIFLGFFSISLAAIFYSKKTKIMPLISGIACLINFIFIVWFTPKFGILGPAIAKVFAYLAMWLVAYIVTRSIAKVAYEHIKLAKIIVSGVFIFIISCKLNFSSITVSIITKGILLIAYMGLLKYFKVVNVLNARLLFTKEKTKTNLSSVEETLPE